ncbi:MAG: hypothetical protein FGM57_02245 [Candidatus Taylorbacteria bacterium]|nr:hypothetical protein [Candidatus Taylorbacteria bacterium]
MIEGVHIQQIAYIIFTFVILAYWTGAFVLLYHLIRFGVGMQPKKIAIIFFAGSLALSLIATLFFAQIALMN